MGKRKMTVIIIIFSLFLFVLWLAFRVGIFVLDRQVFDFQINPIIRRGEIKNLRQYDIVHNYIEMKFETDPDDFKRNPTIKKLNAMMVRYHEKHP